MADFIKKSKENTTVESHHFLVRSSLLESILGAKKAPVSANHCLQVFSISLESLLKPLFVRIIYDDDQEQKMCYEIAYGFFSLRIQQRSFERIS